MGKARLRREGRGVEQLIARQASAGAMQIVIDDTFVRAVRPDLVRFARLQLGNDDEAEDAVQEAIAGALRNARAFRAEAALKTWLIAILKNKVADILRQRRRGPLPASQLEQEPADEPLPDLFNRFGVWRNAARPASWEDPEAAIHSRQFLRMFDACLNCLPPQQGRVFLMREVVELPVDDICDELGLSTANVYVILHRARLALRDCMEKRWFSRKAPTP